MFGEIATMTLTKAELSDLLFEKVGLNKREAKDMVEAFFDEVRDALEKSFPASATFSCAKSPNARDATPRPGKKYRSPLAAWLLSTPAKN